MIPIPSSKSPIEDIPPEIACHILSYLPPSSRISGPDQYASVVLAWRGIRDFVRSQRFRSIIITGEEHPDSEVPLKLRLLMDILADTPNVADCVRHITVKYNDAESAEQVDPYPHLYNVLNICRNIQSASFENLRPSRYSGHTTTYDIDPTVTSSVQHAPITVIPGLKSNATMTELNIAQFDGTVSELCSFLPKFPNLVKLELSSVRKFEDFEKFREALISEDSPLVLDFDNKDIDSVPVGIKPFPNIRVLRCDSGEDMQHSGPSNALMDLVGSPYTIFPRIEHLIYVHPKVSTRVERLLKQLQASLQTLELYDVERRYTSSKILDLPPHLERLYFDICPISKKRPTAGQEFYGRALQKFSQSSRTLKEVKIEFFAVNDLLRAPVRFPKVDKLDTLLSSDELGVEQLGLVIVVLRELPDGAKMNWKVFLQGQFPKVLQKFFGQRSREDGYQGTLHWRYVRSGLVLQDDLLVLDYM